MELWLVTELNEPEDQVRRRGIVAASGEGSEVVDMEEDGISCFCWEGVCLMFVTKGSPKNLLLDLCRLPLELGVSRELSDDGGGFPIFRSEVSTGGSFLVLDFMLFSLLLLTLPFPCCVFKTSAQPFLLSLQSPIASFS